MLSFDKIVPSPTVGGASKEEGPSSSVNGEAATGLVGVGVDDVIVPATGAELGEGRVKAGGSSRKPGLLGDGSKAVGERARLACTVRERGSRHDVMAMSV